MKTYILDTNIVIKIWREIPYIFDLLENVPDTDYKVTNDAICELANGEIDQSLIELAVRGQLTNNSKLVEHADEINAEIKYLEHLVLHEIAHIKNDWRQDRETDCDLWVYEQMHG